MNWKELITGAVIGSILGIAGTFFILGQKTAKLATKIEYLEKQVERNNNLKQERPYQEQTKKMDEQIIEIPLNAGWKPEGLGANGGGYKDGLLILKANLKGSNSSAELFIDLRTVRLPGIKQNTDGSYNLTGRELVASVRSDNSFTGVIPNGVQFLLKTAQWQTLAGPWFNVNSSMESPTGQEIFYNIPDHSISRRTAGICIKFAVGKKSAFNYTGDFIVYSVKIL